MDTLHSRLKTATAEQHASLDALMADGFADRLVYARYLQAMRCLVEALAPAPLEAESRQHWARWFDSRRLKCLHHDLGELGAHDTARQAPVLPASGWMGANYVLEGSALGARVLLREAARLGEREPGIPLEFLRHHAERSDRWPRFLAALEALDGPMRTDACAGARRGFALVAHAMTCEETL